MTTKQVPVASLVEDLSLYPRMEVDDTHVGDLARAMLSGATLPPPVIEAGKSRRIVDGVHRVKAWIRVFGPDSAIEVEMRSYKNDAELFADAVQLNSGHGRKLHRQDRTRVVLRATELGITPEKIAVLLSVTPQEVEHLRVRVVISNAGELVPNKRGAEHLRGTKVTRAQLEALKHVRSAEVGRLCKELTRLIEGRIINLDDPRVLENLRGLSEMLVRFLAKHAA